MRHFESYGPKWDPSIKTRLTLLIFSQLLCTGIFCYILKTKLGFILLPSFPSFLFRISKEREIKMGIGGRIKNLSDDNIERECNEAAPELGDHPAIDNMIITSTFWWVIRTLPKVFICGFYPNDKRINRNLRLSMKQEGSLISHWKQKQWKNGHHKWVASQNVKFFLGKNRFSPGTKWKLPSQMHSAKK